MVIADINVLCVKQKRKNKYKISGTYVDIYYINPLEKPIIYSDRYQTIQKINGIRYQIVPSERKTGKYSQEFLDLHTEEKKLKVEFLSQSFKQKLVVFLKELLISSPAKCIYFFVDLQGYKEDYICMKVDEFFELMQKEQLSFNTVYKISN